MRLVRIALILAALTTFAFAQDAGRISGVVQDPSGAVVPGATVTATEAGTGFVRTAVSNETGTYVFPTLRPTQYTLSAEAPGFRRYNQSGVELQANANITLNLTLTVGDVTETVEVAADAVQVNTTNATLAEVVEQRRIVELPLEGRNAASLTTLVPGAIQANSQGIDSRGVDQGVTKTQQGAVVVSTNGSQQGQVAFKLDGANNTDFYTNANMRFPAPDFLQEYSVQTSNYTAEHGANSGAVVNLVTRSGTNEFHGGGFWFVRNREFNARNTFADAVDPLQRNQFGGFLGGPILRNKTFFFYGFQQTEIRRQQLSENAFVPTNDQLNGDFSTCGGPCDRPIRDFTTGNNFANNRIPVSRFDPASRKLTDFLPRSTGDGFVTFAGGKENQDISDHTVRVDHELSDRDRLMGRYFLSHFDNGALAEPNNLLVYRDQSRIRSQSSALNYTRSFSPTMLNELRIGYNRTHASRNPPDGVPNVIDLGVNLNLNPTPKAIQGITVAGHFDFGDNPTAKFVRNAYEISDGASWIKGNHTIKFGGSLEFQRVDLNNLYRQPATFEFSGDATGYAIADFMLGALSVFDQGMGEFKNNRNWFYTLYLQDDVRISSRLSMNFGVRWEPLKPWHEAAGRLEKFSIEDYQNGVTSTVFRNAPPGESFRGDPGFPHDGTNPDYFNLAPRIGFAYDLMGDGRTSIRGGIGGFFDQKIDDQNNGAVNASPFSTRISLTGQPLPGPFSDPYLGSVSGDPFPAPPPGPDSPFPRPVLLATWTPQIITPLNWNWNLSVERQIATDWMARIAYVGSRGVHGLRGQQLNSAWYDPNNTLADGRPRGGTDARRIFAPAFGSISTFSWDGNNHYHSLQTSLNKRFSQGFTLQMNYTFAKALDNYNDAPIPVVYFEPRPEFLFGDRMNWGSSEFDRRHRVVVSYVWEIPRLEAENAVARFLLNGWQATGVFQAQSGPPLTVVSGRDNSFTGVGDDRAILTGEAQERPAGADKQRQFFNTGAFGVNPFGTFGTVGKGTLTGPALTTWNLGAFKSWGVREGMTFQFRAEFFNMLNSVNLYRPEMRVSNGSFGRITAAEDPRIMQFGLKLLF